MDVLVTAIIIAVMLVIIGVFAFVKYSQRSGGNDATWNPRREGTNDDSDRLGTHF